MFSGIVEEVGTIVGTEDSADGRRFKIGAKLVTEDVQLGQSISVCGCCLTVVDFGKDWFSVELVHETLRKTTLGRLGKGSPVNLERSLKLSDRLGGHLVSGHIEVVAKVVAIEEEGFSRVMTFQLPSQFSPYFVEKGSVAIEGVSLTVWGVESMVAAANASGSPREVSEQEADEQNGMLLFKVALIPHTLSVTTLGTLTVGREVNIETDIVARYVARWLEPSLIGHNLNHPGLGALALPS